MAGEDELTSRELLAQLQRADDARATLLFDRYVVRLLALVRRRMSPRLNQRLDPEDVLQSTFRTFFVHAREGEYVLLRAGDLWRLLAAIAIHKLQRQVELHTAERRDMSREVAPSLANDRLADAAVPEPTPYQLAALAEQMELLFSSLTDGERTILERRLAGCTVEEISNETQRSQRSVRRVLQVACERLEQRLAES